MERGMMTRAAKELGVSKARVGQLVKREIEKAAPPNVPEQQRVHLSRSEALHRVMTRRLTAAS